MFTTVKDSDNYATDKIGWDIIKEYIPKNKKIWSPFYCDGKQKEIFTDLGYNIIHEDKDFFKEYKTKEYDVIIDNPPFSTFKQICYVLKELDKPFILLGFSKIMLMKWFQQLFKDDLQVIVPFQRPTFTHLTSPKKGYTPPFGVMYYCYKINLPKDLIFV
jgi:hypothetical protein